MGNTTVELSQDEAFAWFRKGNAFAAVDDICNALVAYRRAIAIKPDASCFYNNMGQVLERSGDLVGAVEAFSNAIGCDDGNAALHYNLGCVYLRARQYFSAVKSYRKALLLKTDFYLVYANMGKALCDCGSFDEGIYYLREAVRHYPREIYIHSNLLLYLNYIPENDLGKVADSHVVWAKAHTAGIMPRTRHDNMPDPERSLRVGYVSADFCRHPVASFIMPILRHHSRDIEVHCYANIASDDDTTAELRSLVAEWRNIHNVADSDVVDMIVGDGIDILVDLSGHTSGHRLMVFAFKPAPVQVTYLGYPNTTGMDTIDYRIIDDFVDDGVSVEENVKLPGCFLCYQGMSGWPAVATLPALCNKYITFGSFNNLRKVNVDVVRAWAEILKAVPTAQFILKGAFNDLAMEEHYYDMFETCGVGRERIDLQGFIATDEGHLEAYNNIDISLDPFPYNGATTTFESLWMGVPVVTLVGYARVSMVGKSILSNLGMRALIAYNVEDYISRACHLAEDIGFLVKLRAMLRPLIQKSILGDAVVFTRNLEGAYRKIWRRWCVGASSLPEKLY